MTGQDGTNLRRALLAFATGIALTSSALAQTAAPFALTSPKLEDNAMMDKAYGADATPNGQCGGTNTSLPLAWTNAPAGTKSFGILLVDIDAGRGPGFVHWVAYDIAADATGLAEGEGSKASPKFVGGNSGLRRGTYFGPCPPVGDRPHHYVFMAFALDLAPGALAPGLNRDEFLDKTKGHVLATSTLIGRYAR